MSNPLQSLYKKWCKKTNRGGAILDIPKFIEKLKENYVIIKK